MRKFDLNIEKILEDWEIHHAIREIIANALDEKLLTNTEGIKIYKDSYGLYHIRDFGRGLKHEHLTQKEDDEKLNHPEVIGKFGIGLKDALATFNRNKVIVTIKSQFCDIKLSKSEKHGFEDIITLHADIFPPSEPKFIGTEVTLDKVTDEDIKKAKNLFLFFSGEKNIDKTSFGEILEKKSSTGRIYINGVKVAEEDNFLFSYNITSLTSAIRKALNRERSNVGRSAYSSRVKSILLSSTNFKVAEFLVNDMKQYSTGLMHDELKWIDIQEHAVKILNAKEKSIFVTSDEILYKSSIISEAIDMGYKIVTIPSSLREKIKGIKDIKGNLMVDLDRFKITYNDSFQFNFIPIYKLTSNERKIFKYTDKILNLIGEKPKKVKNIKISSKMRKDFISNTETTGVWEPKTATIIIKRTQLKNIESYAGTLLHEIAHATSNAPDLSRVFEGKLTHLLGRICNEVL